jgi:hypothetical protein
MLLITTDSLIRTLLTTTTGAFNPFAFHLIQVPWAVFGTLTWERDAATVNTAAAEAIRSRDFFWLIRMACRRLKLRQRRLGIYRKLEWGQGERGHYNFLIAKDGIGTVTPAQLSDTLQKAWTEDSRKGLAKIEPFDAERGLAGVTYQSKPEYDARGQEIWLPEYFSPALTKRFEQNSRDQHLIN